jgi:2-(1,2-epoxy-1,2-dihydrophenyl)acetyl-CoA isomerase
MSAVELHLEGGIAQVTLNRPEHGNAIDLTLAGELARVAACVASDPAIRCVLLTGAGRLFCAGGDIMGFAAAGDQASPHLRHLAEELHRAVIQLATMPKPLIVAVNGPAAGAGLSLAILGDIVIASRRAHFTTAYSTIGLTPDGGMTWLLPRLIGLRRAQDMILSNRRVSAEEGQAIGLVSQVVDDDDLLGECRKAALVMAAAPTSALGGAKKLLLEAPTRTFAEQLAVEAERIAQAGASPEACAGIATCLERFAITR